MPAGSGARVYRTRLTTTGGWVFFAVCMLLALSGVITLLNNHSSSSTGATIAQIAAIVAIGTVSCLSARAASAAIYTDDIGIRIRNVILIDRFLWEDIDRFELRERRPFPRVCAVVLRDGTVLRAVGIQAADGLVESSTAPAEKLVEELNEELRMARTRS
jgi:hypothetical protein